MKRLLCLLLVLLLCVSMAACAPEEKKSESAQPASRLNYVSAFTDLIRGSREYITVRGYENGRVFYSQSEIVGDNTPAGVIPDFEGQYSIYETFLYSIGEDGVPRRVEHYKSIDAPANDLGYRNFSSGSELLGICFTPEGFVTAESSYAFWTEGEEDPETGGFPEEGFEQQYCLRSFDAEGTELTCAALTVPDEIWIEFEGMQLDGSGNVLFPAGDRLLAFGLDGQQAYSVELDSDSGRLIRLPDSRLAVIGRKGGYQFSVLDGETGTLTGTVPIAFGPENAVTGGGAYDICYTDGDYFYGWKYESADPEHPAEPERLFSWISQDVSSSTVQVVDVAEDGAVTGVITRFDEQTSATDLSLVTVSPTTDSAAAQKQVLRLGALYSDYKLQEMIIDFNRRSPDYRIELVDYGVFGSNQDGTSGGETMLNTELVSGGGPDILCLADLNYQKLASKGLLEDLYPYIDADPDLDRADFFPNVLQVLEEDGKLCATASGFFIISAVGAASVVGDEPGWTYEEFNEALASMPEGCTAFDSYTTRDDILTTCLALDMADFVDWESGSVHFDSPAFLELLAFAKSFPSELDWENPEFADDTDVGERLSQGRQMLAETGSSGLEDVFYSTYSQYLGGEITYIGYPSSHGSGNMFSFEEEPAYAINSNSTHKDAAWQFLRTFFTADYQTRLVCLPTRVDVFEAKAADAVTVKYRKNDEGKYELDANGEKIPLARYLLWNNETNRPEEVYAASEEQVEKARQLVLTTTKAANYNADIISIVEEQAAPYFAGQKSAEEVARLVQSKANIYVNEQR